MTTNQEWPDGGASPAGPEGPRRRRPPARPEGWSRRGGPIPGYDDPGPQDGDPQQADPQYAQSQYADPQYPPSQYTDPRYADPQYSEPQYADPRYAGPSSAEPGYGDPRRTAAQEGPDPLAARATRAGTPGDDRPRRGNRTALAALGLVAVAVAASAAGWSLGNRDDPASTPIPPAAASSPSPSDEPSPRASTSSKPPAVPLSGVGTTDPGRARSDLQDAGIKVPGDPLSAWQWTDRQGRNLLVLSKRTDEKEGDVLRAATLFVTHAAGVDGDDPKLLRRLTDPGTKGCDTDFALDFTRNSVTVTDADRDGRGEATAGWWASCRGDPGPVRVKLALLTAGKYYILRGEGLPVDLPPLPGGVTAPKASFVPDPSAGGWPAGTYEPTVALFKQLYK